MRDPRTYLKALAGWLLLTNIGHTALGMPHFETQAADPSATLYPVLRTMIDESRGGVFDYSVFDVFMMGMLALTMMLLLATMACGWVAWRGEPGTVSQFAKLNFGFWLVALVAFALYHPVDNMVAIGAGAVLLSGLALLATKLEYVTDVR